MKKILSFFLACMTLAACADAGSETAASYTDWCYAFMPFPDSVMCERAWVEKNVVKTLQVRDLMGWKIPEREFRHFVLPLRVNNETLDDFRLVYADTLCRRVAGMSMAEAALEINHWCHEQATYRPSDGRTSGPMATVRRGVGRCGEESVLAVAALRAAGIPARQVYTPRWAHTDDNHAWVEAWVDGRWHFMGACEPEPALDMAWFNGSVSRAMLLHTKVFGDYDGPEDVIERTPCYTEINVIRNYVPSRRTVATVTRGGAPVEGASVSFRIYNYAELYPVATYRTDSEGHASLDTGRGDLFVWASDGEDFGFSVASGEEVTVELSHRLGEEFSVDLDIVPPAENPLPALASDEAVAANARRLAEEDAIRASHDHSNPALAGFDHPEVLEGLSEKDLGDVTADVLADALYGTGSPRVELEHLLPFRGEVLSSGLRLSAADEVEQWVRDSIRVRNDKNPQGLRIPPVGVWRSRVADPLGRDIFHVALCRAMGIDASYDPVTGKVASAVPSGTVETGSVRYFSDYTFTRITPEGTRLMDYESGVPDAFCLEAGYYLMTSGSRMADGSVLAHLRFFNVREGAVLRMPPLLRTSSDKLAVIGSMDAEAPFLRSGSQAEQSLLSATGRGYFLVAVLGEKDEPSLHAVSELSSVAPDLSAWGRPVLILGAGGGDADGEGISGLEETAIYGIDSSGAVLATLGARKAPVVAVCDSFGRVVYRSEGYNTSLGADLRRVLSLL